MDATRRTLGTLGRFFLGRPCGRLGLGLCKRAPVRRVERRTEEQLTCCSLGHGGRRGAGVVGLGGGGGGWEQRSG